MRGGGNEDPECLEIQDLIDHEFLAMWNRSFLSRIVLSIVALPCVQMMGASVSSRPPNLLIVFPDQMRGQAMGFLGEDPVVTPNLDRFASESLVLPQAVSNYPVCSPFRAMLMTGQYAISNGVHSNCTSGTEPYGVELKESSRCWSDVLKEKGYSLGYIGKWHLDSPRPPYVESYNNRGPGQINWNEWCPPERRHGFDYWYSYGTYDRHLNPMYWDTHAKRDGFHHVDQWGPEHEADKAIDYIRNVGAVRDGSKPFALVVSMNPPHTPYDQFPEKYLKAYEGKSDRDLLVRPNVDLSGKGAMSQLALSQTRNYFASITGVDDQFGRILRALEKEGLKDNTIVLFTSDHGNCVGTHDEKTKNVHYEESMRVPFLLRWPGKIVPRRDDLLISSPDIYPTLLDMMGFSSDIPSEVEGASHASRILTGEGSQPSSQLYMWIESSDRSHGRRGVRTVRWKLMIETARGNKRTSVLHDLQNDPFERVNIAEQHPEVVGQLIESELIPWLEKTKDPWISRIR